MANIEMRAVLLEALRNIMLENDKVVVLDADLAKATGTWPLRHDFPERAIDVGIAEQNMASIAAGMSSYGYIPFITSFSPFVTRRICDQVMLSIAYAKQNVKIIGTDPGITAEINGGTHMGLEDIAILRSIPDMVIFEPVDATQLKLAMPQIMQHYGPLYIRLFRKAIDDVFDSNYKFDLFKADLLKEGKDVTIFCSGIMTQVTLAAKELLANAGIDAEIINIHTIKPIDKDAIIASVKKTRAAITVENHNIIGGLYSAVTEVTARYCPTAVLPIGVPDVFGEVGKLPYLTKLYGMTKENIVTTCIQAMQLKQN